MKLFNNCRDIHKVYDVGKMNRDGFNPIFDMLEIDRRVGSMSRNFHNRRNFDDAIDWEQRYRLQSSSVSYILERIGPHLEMENRLGSLSPKQQLLTTLHFYSSNAFYHVMRDSHGPSESTVCQAIRRVTNALNTAMFDDVIGWPSSCDNLAQKFFNVGGMPSVCGAVDGILIPIIAPSVDQHQYVDRHKIGHSINVMAVAGPALEFFYISARWPGSVNDARVLRRSSLNDAFTSGYRPFPDAVLLGDYIYPTKRWLIPPIQSPQINAEAAFNAAQKRT